MTTSPDYRRELDLDRRSPGLATWSMAWAITREVFVSAPDQVLVVRLTADRPGAIPVPRE